jgi:hypothetical protein
MFKISQAQMRSLSQSATQRFTERVIAQLKENFPAHLSSLKDSRLREIIHDGIERAASYGFITERHIYLYINLMFALGYDFDTNPQVPWASSILQSCESSEIRIAQLYDAAIGQIE